MPPTTCSQVAIFWDYENCRLSNDSDGNKVIDRIQCIVQSFGSITTFRAYLDLSLDCAYSRSITLHSDLQSSGLTLVHCPHNGKKDVADKMMIVDMLAFAIDRPAPACIVLITGDRDFAYAAAILKLRGYHVIVISPTCNTHSSLKVRAHELYDWQNDVLGGTGGGSPVINSSGHKVVGSVASASQMNGGSIPEATGSIVSRDRSIPAPLKLGSATQTLASVCDSRPASIATLDVDLDAAARAVQADSTPGFLTGSLSGNRVTARSADERSTLVGMTAEDAQSMRTTEGSQSLTGPQIIACPSPVKPIGSKISYFGRGATSLPSTTDTNTPSNESSLVSEPISSSFYDNLSSREGYGISNTLNPVLRQFGLGAVERAMHQDEYTPFFAGVNETEKRKATIISRNSTDTINSITTEASQIRSDSASLSSKTVPLNPQAASFLPTFQTEQTNSTETQTTRVETSEHAFPAPSPRVSSTNSTESPSVESKQETQPPRYRLIGRFFPLILCFIEQHQVSGLTRLRASFVASAMLRMDPNVYRNAGVTGMKQLIKEARLANVLLPSEGDENDEWIEISPNCDGFDFKASRKKHDQAQAVNSKPTTSGAQITVDPIFKPLVERLRMARPSYKVERDKLATFFSEKHPGLYKSAGVGRLKAYLNMAEKRGLVVPHKKKKRVELAPALRVG